MLKKNITFNDFDANNEEVTRAFYFNLTDVEILELDADYDDDLVGVINRIGTGEATNKQILKFFKDLIGAGYGERTSEGRFIKNTERTQCFVVTDAYSKLFRELISNAEAGAEFVEGLMPADLVRQVKEERAAKEKSELQQKFVERANERVVDGTTQAATSPADHMERPTQPTRRELREGEHGGHGIGG